MSRRRPDLLRPLDDAADLAEAISALQVLAVSIGVALAADLKQGSGRRLWVRELASELLDGLGRYPDVDTVRVAFSGVLSGFRADTAAPQDLPGQVGRRLAEVDPDGASADVRRSLGEAAIVVDALRSLVESFRTQLREECVRCARRLFESDGVDELHWAVAILLLPEPLFPQQLAAHLGSDDGTDVDLDRLDALVNGALEEMSKHGRHRARLVERDHTAIAVANAAPVPRGAVALTPDGRRSVREHVATARLMLAS